MYPVVWSVSPLDLVRSLGVFFPLIILVFGNIAVDRPPPTDDLEQNSPSGLEADPYAPNGRLAIPTLTEHPTQIEIGRSLFYYNCMPCHGDKGQGLTDEFRSLWEKDHQNCWERGCHGGHGTNEGFPLPTAIPAVVSSSFRQRFIQLEMLFTYLKTTHPPQNPGGLKDEEYQALTAYLFFENGSKSDTRLNDQSYISPLFWLSAGGILVSIIIAYLVFRLKSIKLE